MSLHRPPKRIGPPRIVAIDDDVAARQLLRRALERDGIRLIPYDEGLDGVEGAQTFLPDAVVTDLNLPRGLQGEDIVALLRENPATEHIPIVVLTGTDDPARRTQVEAAAGHRGLAGWIVKPADIYELKRLVLEAVGLDPGEHP